MGAHFDNISAKLSAFALKELDVIEAEEKAAGGFVSDIEISVGCNFARPRIARMIRGVLKSAMDEYQSVSVGELVNLIDGLFSEKRAEAP